MKIILLGKSGMLGSRFSEVLNARDDVELFEYDSSELDISDFDGVKSVLGGIDADYVINCAAYTDVDGAEHNEKMATLINSEAVGHIAKLCGSATLIHFSTDYVFDGKKAEGYAEKDDPSPINAYGRSKLGGELTIQKNMDNYYIVRTSWLYGPGGKNFVDTMLGLDGEVRVVGDQIGSPTYSFDLVDAVLAEFVDGDANFGVYHLTNSGSCSWYEFAEEIFKLASKSVILRKVGSEEFERDAKRPSYSILNNSKTGKMREWGDGLSDYLA